MNLPQQLSIKEIIEMKELSLDQLKEVKKDFLDFTNATSFFSTNLLIATVIVSFLLLILSEFISLEKYVDWIEVILILSGLGLARKSGELSGFIDRYEYGHEDCIDKALDLDEKDLELINDFKYGG